MYNYNFHSSSMPKLEQTFCVTNRWNSINTVFSISVKMGGNSEKILEKDAKKKNQSLETEVGGP